MLSGLSEDCGPNLGLTLPNHMLDQLRYTQLWNFLIVVMCKNVPSNENSLK